VSILVVTPKTDLDFEESSLKQSASNVTAFWYITSSCLVEVDWHFRGSYCLHHQSDALRLPGTSSWKAIIFTFATMRT
jgi:hypothetical protein